jgi:hypothetical protein
MKNKCYRIKGNSPYFRRKYGTPNPIIRIEAEDTEMWAGGWGYQEINPTCLLYGKRFMEENLPITGKVYYGHIREEVGELVHESELGEEIEEYGARLEPEPSFI